MNAKTRLVHLSEILFALLVILICHAFAQQNLLGELTDGPSPWGDEFGPDVFIDPSMISIFPDFEGSQPNNEETELEPIIDSNDTTPDLGRRAAKDFYLRVMPLGASFTEGQKSSHKNGYRKHIRDQLRFKGWKVNMVGSKTAGTMKDKNHEGHGGYVITEIHGQFTKNKDKKPNMILLNAGINDCGRPVDPGNAGIRIKALIDDIFNSISGVTVILSSLLPSKDHGTCAAMVTDQYRVLAKTYIAQGARLAFADFLDFMDVNDLDADGIHPNDGGYRKAAAVWWDAISKVEDKIQPPLAVSTDDAAVGSSDKTCVKKAGDARGPVQTQWGSGYDDGKYKHASVSRGPLADLKIAKAFNKTMDDAVPSHIFFAQLVNPGNIPRSKALDDWVRVLHEPDGKNKYWYRKNLGSGNFAASQQIDVKLNCDMGPHYAFADFNNDGLDDFFCLGVGSKVSVALNRGGDPPRFESIGQVVPTHDGFEAADVRIADIDGDGRADYCLIADNGDILCSRNGGQGDTASYWQGFTTPNVLRSNVFNSQNKPTKNGVRLHDLNGDFRTDWMYIGTQGNIDTWINQRGWEKGIRPSWHNAGTTHPGLGKTINPNNIRFGRIFGSGRLDYIYIKEEDAHFDAHVWENKGNGGTKRKGDGNFYCDMTGNGADDYVWIFNDGHVAEMWMHPGEGNLPPWGRKIMSLVTNIPGPRIGVHLADWDGDGRCDILTQNQADGKLTMWRNDYNAGTGVFKFTNIGPVAAGARCGQGWGVGIFDRGLRLHDIDGDKRADYLCIEKNGRISGWLNQKSGLVRAGLIKHTEGWDRANIRFADVEGSGRADLLHLNKYDGSATVFKNAGYNKQSPSADKESFNWGFRGTLYASVGGRGETIHFANLGGSGRSSIHHVLPVSNRAYTYFNDCGGVVGGDDGAIGDPALPSYTSKPIISNPPKGGSWLEIPCTDSGVEQATTMPQEERWKRVDATTALDAAIAEFKKRRDANTLKGFKFVHILSAFFRGPESMNCHEMVEKNGCSSITIMCGDNQGLSPAGYFIVNSIANINKNMWNFFNGVGDAAESVDKQLKKFESYFSTVEDKTQFYNLIFDVLGLGFSTAAAPIFNTFLKRSNFFTDNADKLENLKDTNYAAISWGITIIKDKGYGDTISVKDLAQDMLSDIADTYKAVIDKLNQEMNSGSDTAINYYRDMIIDGRMLFIQDQMSALEISNVIAKSIYAVMIPMAWTVSEDYPFILDTGLACKDAPDLDDYVGEKNLIDTWVCVDDRSYHLLSVRGKEAEICSQPPFGSPMPVCNRNKFRPPPGLDQLTGKPDIWGGLIREDYVVGSLNGFTSNGRKNGWPKADVSKSKTVNEIQDRPVRAPGVMNVPICGAVEAYSNWLDFSKLGRLSANYPCN